MFFTPTYLLVCIIGTVLVNSLLAKLSSSGRASTGKFLSNGASRPFPPPCLLRLRGHPMGHPMQKDKPGGSTFSVEGAILNSCSLFLSFFMYFTRVFFRNTHFVREWGQRHLKKSKKGQQNHPKNDSRTTPGTLWGQLGAQRWILDPTWGSNAD